MPVKFKNKHNLPQYIVDAILVNDHVTQGDISVTTLIDSPQIRMLKKNSDYEMDVMDMVAMAMGTGLHTVIERGDIKGSVNSRLLQRAAGVLLELGEEKGSKWLMSLIDKKLKETIDDNIINEKTLSIEFDGMEISGTFDRFDIANKHMDDNKMTGASAVMFPEQKKAWDRQLNVYAYMLRQNGYDIKTARIIAFLKDWSKMKVKSNKDYPKTPIIMHDIKLYDDKIMEKYLKQRVNLHRRAEQGEEIPCTVEERWAKPDMFAAKLEGGKRAKKVLDNEKLIDAYILKEQPKHAKTLVKEFRPGQSLRCSEYCPVSKFCPQYKKEMEITANNSQDI